jgi:hypothetical protein
MVKFNALPSLCCVPTPFPSLPSLPILLCFCAYSTVVGVGLIQFQKCIRVYGVGMVQKIGFLDKTASMLVLYELHANNFAIFIQANDKSNCLNSRRLIAFVFSSYFAS